MTTGRLTFHVVGMFVFGALALLCAGFLYQARHPQTPGPSHSTDERPRGTSGGRQDTRELQDRIRAGVYVALRRSADAIEQRNMSGGAAALDGAYRVSDVLRMASGSEDTLFPLVQAARTALFDGDRATAVSLERLATSIPRAQPVPLFPVSQPSAFVGAAVFSEFGDRLGDVVAIDDDRIVLESGGLRNVLGFLSLSHGSRRSVSKRDAIFGAPRTLGTTTIVVATRTS